jgi:hypothetical protein
MLVTWIATLHPENADITIDQRFFIPGKYACVNETFPVPGRRLLFANSVANKRVWLTLIDERESLVDYLRGNQK